MKAGEVVFQELLNGKIQYRVPLFQRTYSWKEENWQRLWDDLLEIYALEELRGHFIGAVVYVPIPDLAQNAVKFMLIDGQQRLTTLFILLAVVRDAAKQRGLADLADAIQEECLINKHGQPAEREKMLPTQQDQAQFKTVIAGSEADKETRVGMAQRFFRMNLQKGDLDGQPIDLGRLKSCITNYLNLVSIKLDQSDSPHRIFESLNNTGMALTASDLIRNHVFMRIPSEEEQNHAYSTYWYPMQQRLEHKGESALSDFFWRSLMKDGALPRYDEVFESMRIRIDKDYELHGTSILKILEELSRYSEYYLRISRPNPYELKPPVRSQLERLNDWEVDVAYPFMLNLMDKRRTGIVSDGEVLEVLCIVESYVVRRFICGVPTNRLRRIFASMSGLVKDGDYVESCRAYLMANDWPTDDLFHKNFQTVPVYNPSRLARTRLILAALEDSYAHHEPITISDTITIEHIMPQTLNAAWTAELGSKAHEIQDKYLHTIGNLTFSGYNAEMGNAPFSQKKNVLAQSHFELNQAIVQHDHWTEHEIRARAVELADRAVLIWQREG